MTILHHRNLFTMKSWLCTALMLYSPIALTGCGGNGVIGLPLSQIQIPLGPDNPLTQALAGTTFQGAVAIEVMPATKQFRLVFRDNERQVSGFYAFENNEFTISEFSFKNSSGAASVLLDSDRKVKSITTWGGESWTRFADSLAARSVGSAVVQSDNAYMAANADLIEFAEVMDQSGGTSSTATISGTPASTIPGALAVPGKTTNAAPLDQNEGPGLRTVLTVLAAIWAPLVGILQPLLTFFTVAAVVEKALTLRFDGTWKATNASSNLLLTIDHGKITKMVDADSSQELTIVDSRMDRLDGDRVIWAVITTVLGQSTEVEFTFDVQELSNGDLEGTLTALGNSYARVPVTMTRV